MNVLLIRHGRNYYEAPEHDGSLALELNPAGQAYARKLLTMEKIVAVKSQITQIYAWSGREARCVDTVQPLADATGKTIVTYGSAEKAAEIAQRLKTTHAPGWAVMCVRTQDLNKLCDIFPECDQDLLEYERFVAYEAQRIHSGATGSTGGDYAKVNVFRFGHNTLYSAAEEASIVYRDYQQGVPQKTPAAAARRP